MGVVGVDFGARGAKFLQVREHNGHLTAVGAARIELDSPTPGSDPRTVDGAALTAQIREAFIAGGFTGRKCVVSLPRTDICIQSIRLPKMPDEEMRQSAVWESSQRFGFERHAMEVDFIRTGASLQSGENREEVILIAVSHAAIHARVNPLLAAGLRPIALDTGFAALVRAFSRQARREADLSTVRAIVEIGFHGSMVVILRGDQIAFCKPITIGGEQFNQAVAEHLQMDERAAGDLRCARIGSLVDGPPTDPATDRAVYDAVRPLMGDLVKEVTLCLRYYGVTFRGKPPELIILTGGDGLEPRLGEVMSQACKAPVVFDDPLTTLGGLLPSIQKAMNRTPGPAATWTVAAGLSLRGVSARRSRRTRTIASVGPVRKAAA
jgi:type IV pilus assembly protein PilM